MQNSLYIMSLSIVVKNVDCIVVLKDGAVV